MFTAEQLQIELEKNDHLLDMITISNFLKVWKIDPVYENEEGINFFDELAISKLSQGIFLREHGKNNAEIAFILNSGLVNPASIIEESAAEIKIQKEVEDSTQKQNKASADVIRQTLTLLAGSAAAKLNINLFKKPTKTHEIINLNDSELKNQGFFEKIDKVVEENRELRARINFLEQEISRFKRILGIIYIKL